MKHCNFRFDDKKGEWMPKSNQPMTDEIDKKNELQGENVRIQQNGEPVDLAENDGSLEMKL